ncbi:MAG: site-2 protease family protein [Clostridia bacterium]|nr:site-2 protease family protein [Clostridia bacterium]
MNTIIYILITVLVIGFLTFIHEFGHFFFARLFKVPIIEFAIGMGPRLYSWTGKHGTKYALRAFPIGGFVQMEGEEGTSENPMAYNNLNPWKKIVVTAAGPLVNIIFAVIVMFILVICSPELGSTTIGRFEDDAVSNQKLMEWDEIVQVGDTRVHTGEEVVYEIMMQGYEAIDITVIRDGERLVIEDVVFNTVEEQGAVLAEIDFRLFALSVLDDVSFFDYLYQAFYRSVNMVKMVYDSLLGMITGRFGMDAMSGPIGIVETVGQVAQVSIASLVNLIVMISMNLGIFNLLPVPALDGGRILFHLIDGIAGRKVIKKEIEDTITAVTMMLLLGFMLLISIKDVINLF